MTHKGVTDRHGPGVAEKAPARMPARFSAERPRTPDDDREQEPR
jgi:hypothetical protein